MATTTKSFKSSRTFSLLVVAGSGLIWLALLLLPADFFDSGESLCVSQLLLGQSCYGCGMTRAIMHLIHFDFATAYEFNRISFIVFPILSFLWAKEVWEHSKRLRSV